MGYFYLFPPHAFFNLLLQSHHNLVQVVVNLLLLLQEVKALNLVFNARRDSAN